MGVRINLFGGFSVQVDGRAVSFDTKPTEALCALLSLNLGRTLDRRTVTSQIWPEVEIEKGLTRLRTCLVRLKKALSPIDPLQADRYTIAMDPEEIELDLEEAERSYRLSQVSHDRSEERTVLQAFLRQSNGDLLAGWSDEWVIQVRTLWNQRRTEAGVRLANIALDLGEFEISAEEADRALAIEPFSEEAWACYLRAMFEADKGRVALDRFRHARQRIRTELELDFSPELAELAKGISSGAITKQSDEADSSVIDRDFMGKLVEDQLSINPDSVLPLLAGPAFFRQAVQSPIAAWRLLQKAIERTEGTEKDRMGAMLVAMTMADLVDQLGAAFDYGEWLLENLPESRPEFWRSLSFLGFMSFEIREWDASQRYLERYLDVTQRYGDQTDVAVAKMQLSGVRWHMGQTEQAYAVYEEIQPVLAQDNSPRGVYNQTMLLLNQGFFGLAEFKWADALEAYERCFSLAVASRNNYARASLLAPMGLCQVMMGKVSEGSRSAARGLNNTYRSHYRRMHQIAADSVAGLLIQLGYRDIGLSLLEHYTELRGQARHERSVVEERLATWIREQAGPGEFDLRWPPCTKATEIVSEVCEVLDRRTLS